MVLIFFLIQRQETTSHLQESDSESPTLHFSTLHNCYILWIIQWWRIHWNMVGFMWQQHLTKSTGQSRWRSLPLLLYWKGNLVWALKLINIWKCSLLVWFQTLQFNTVAFSYIKHKVDLNSIKRDVSYVFKYDIYVWILSHLVTRQLLKENLTFPKTTELS